MSFSWPGIVLFALAALLVLAMIALVDPPPEMSAGSPRVSTWDAWNSAPTPRPGEILLHSPTASALLREAALLGDAQAALSILQRMHDRVRDPANLVHPTRALKRELATDDAEASVLVKEETESPGLASRKEALQALETWHDQPAPLGETVALLRSIEMDATVGPAVEQFFLPCATGPAGQIYVGAAPDRLAARAVHSAGGDPHAVPSSSCRLVADAFRDKGRPRARVRWLLRALERKPADAELAHELSQIYLSRGLVRPALVVLSISARAGGTARDFEQRRAEISGWLSLHEEEASALEALLAFAEDAAIRRRCFDLYQYLGQTGPAADHRAQLARLQDDPAGLGIASRMEMENGDAELAYALIDEASHLAEDPKPWRELLVETYLSDMLTDRAVEELRRMKDRWPEADYEQRLASVLRRTNRRAELADLLVAKARRDGDETTLDEAISLCLTLGRIDELRELTHMKILSDEEPDRFFANLAAYLELDVPGLPERAINFAHSERLDPEGAADAIHHLAALRDRVLFNDVTRHILERYPKLRMEAGDGLGEGVDEPVGSADAVPEEGLSGVALADRHFTTERMDLALPLYEARLAEDPADAHALMRIGQIRSFGNDPYGAIEIFTRVLRLGGDELGELHFLLGESYWATQRPSLARHHHEIALEMIRAREEITVPEETMIAKILGRLGRPEEATAIMERLVVLSGRSPDLLLDQADLLVVLDRREEARRIVDEVLLLAPNRFRVQRMSATLLLLEERYAEALAAADRAVELNGRDASYSAIRAEALIGLDRLAEAAVAYEDVIHRRPNNRSAAANLRMLRDRLASPVATCRVRTTSLGEDASRTAVLQGSTLLDEELTRFSAHLELAHYEGSAFAHREGESPARADFALLGLALARRLGDGFEVAAGPDLYAGRPGGGVLGGWLESSWTSRTPYARIALRFHLDETLTNPTAAPALEGRSTGVDLTGFVSGKEASWWLFGRIGLAGLSIRTEELGKLSDQSARVELSVGHSFLAYGPEIQESLHARRSMPVRTGSTVAGEPSADLGPRLAAWVSFSEARLLDGADLEGPLPLVERTRYATLTGRFEERVADGLVLELEGYVGVEFGRAGVFTGGTLGLVYRPTASTSFRLQGSYGDAFGRPDEEGGSTSLELALTLRW